jgi:hypothetical protein
VRYLGLRASRRASEEERSILSVPRLVTNALSSGRATGEDLDRVD